MADVEPIPAAPDARVSLDSVPASQDTASDVRGEHEASGVVDQDPNAQADLQDNAEARPRPDQIAKDLDRDLHESTQQDVFIALGPASITEVSKKADLPSKDTTSASKDMATVPAKPASGKVNSSTPTHKKASASATLGAGSVKAAPSGKTAATPSSPLSKTTTATPPTAKKLTTAPSASQTKSVTMASSRGSGPGPAPPSRRSSMLPPRAPSATGAPPPKSRTSTLLASLASSTSSKPPPADANATSRPSVVSPVGSVSSLKSNATGAPPLRPRAAVSEAVKRTPSSASSRQSLPPAVAQPPQTRPGPMRPVGSISSIRELRDDGKALDDLQEKLKEANERLSVKSDAVATLEAKVLELEASLSEAIVDARTKTSTIQQLQIGKQSSDADLNNLRARLQELQAAHSRDLATLDTANEQLSNANELLTSQTESIQTLEAQIETLQADIVAAHENFESLRVSSDQSSSEAAAAAQMEREAFLRAKADIETVTAEVSSLRAAHNRALQDVTARSSEAQQRATEVIALTAQIDNLKAEREDNAAKVSELEVEILELKESQENAEDEHKQTLDRLEAELASAVAATEQVLRDVEARDVENKQMAADTASFHTNQLQLVKSDLAKAVSEAEALRSELAAAHATHDETKAAAHATAEAHEQEMEEAEQSFLSKHIELAEEIKRLTAELEGEEAKYRVQINTLEAEYDQRLEEAFERAKNDAGEAHGQDLQVLRAESHTTIQQLRAAHQSNLDQLRTEHEATLESQVSALEQKFNNQSLELRATQDDLTRAKAATDTSRAENESLKAQLEDARVSFLAISANADQVTEIGRLTQELGSLRDENIMLNDVLAVTKESLSDMSTNHSKELEEAARLRVEEVMRLRTIHDGELSTLAAQKSELALSLSDLQGENTMLRVQLAATEPAVAPRSNGTVHASATTVTRDEVQRVHEAHNLKMHDLQAEHERVVRGLRAEVGALQARLDEVQQDVARKSMEIQYLEQEQEESQDSITRLKADLEQLKSAP